MSKFLIFRRIGQSPKYAVKNKSGDTIGYVSFYKRWKKWVFEPAHNDIVCDAECLRDIAEFMERLK